jgi:hypothetical protein
MLYKEGFKRIRQRHTFPGITQVSSAQMGLTSLFGMGRGGLHRYSHLKGHLEVVYILQDLSKGSVFMQKAVHFRSARLFNSIPFDR